MFPNYIKIINYDLFSYLATSFNYPIILKHDFVKDKNITAFFKFITIGDGDIYRFVKLEDKWFSENGYEQVMYDYQKTKQICYTQKELESSYYEQDLINDKFFDILREENNDENWITYRTGTDNFVLLSDDMKKVFCYYRIYNEQNNKYEVIKFKYEFENKLISVECSSTSTCFIDSDYNYYIDTKEDSYLENIEDKLDYKKITNLYSIGIFKEKNISNILKNNYYGKKISLIQEKNDKIFLIIKII